MSLSRTQPLEPRKTPVQARSAVTVEVIFEAAIQVLLTGGHDRLTTTRVAERAGVSVGTLYQYYPNKHALLSAVLERHLSHVARSLEQACRSHAGLPVAQMVEAMVGAFVAAKMDQVEISKALYAISSDLNGDIMVGKLRKRMLTAVSSMLATASDVEIDDLTMAAFMLLASMAGTMRAVLETGVSTRKASTLRAHLVMLCEGYLSGLCNRNGGSHGLPPGAAGARFAAVPRRKPAQVAGSARK